MPLQQTSGLAGVGVPSLYSTCLPVSPLQYGSVAFSPVDGNLPSRYCAIARPGGRAHLRRVTKSFAFLPFGSTDCLVKKDRAEVCLLSQQDHVAVVNSLVPIHPITGWPSLAPHSFTRILIGFPCGLLSQSREEYGLTTFRRCNTDGLDPAYPPVAFLSVYPESREGYPATCPFGSSLSASLACCPVTTFISSSLKLVLPSSLAPHLHWCLQMPPFPHGFGAAFRLGFIVLAASYHVLPRAHVPVGYY